MTLYVNHDQLQRNCRPYTDLIWSVAIAIVWYLVLKEEHSQFSNPYLFVFFITALNNSGCHILPFAEWLALQERGGQRKTGGKGGRERRGERKN